MLKRILKNAIQKIPLRTTLIVPFTIQISEIVGLVGYISFRVGQRAVNDLALQLIEETSTRIEQHIVNYLNKSQNTLWLNHAGIKSDNFNLKDFEKLRRYFWQVVHKFQNLFISANIDCPICLAIACRWHFLFGMVVRWGFSIHQYALLNPNFDAAIDNICW